MAQSKTKVQKLEKEALLKKHEVELAKLEEKHKQGNRKPSASKPIR